ncbi:MAG TPA: hypothetical protein DC058_00925 [Planctomycetaceae bacterium]|nr:hypothetical protein [Planctomycetaceae bacterium]HBC59766.1 hypothetical protein [Planctomycetaceae bacterium]
MHQHFRALGSGDRSAEAVAACLAAVSWWNQSVWSGMFADRRLLDRVLNRVLSRVLNRVLSRVLNRVGEIEADRNAAQVVSTGWGFGRGYQAVRKELRESVE